jgi:hypothetical protein
MFIMAERSPWEGGGLMVDPLMRVLEITEPELFAPGVLPGESFAEAVARRQAAADILDDLLAEAAELAGGVR